MGRGIARLSALAVSKAKAAGWYCDGGGLYLQVMPTGTKSWIFRFMLSGRSRVMGLGPLHTVTLAEARDKALRCRRLCLEGIDPIEARKQRLTEVRLNAARSITFQAAADGYIKAHEAGWRNKVHAAQWGRSLEKYAYPIFRSASVQEIDVTLVMKVLEPIWKTKTVTASRLRGRIEAILDWAKVRGYRQGDNSARWRGHLENLLPKRSKVKKVKHHAALPYADMTTFMAELREQQGVAPRALEFLVLTAARTGEVIGLRDSEIDLQEAVWTVPANRIKGEREHRVPLSQRAIAILNDMRIEREEAPEGATAYVFPGAKPGQPLSNMAMAKVLQRMGYSEFTVHGFRSTFRDWTAECTDYPNEVAEMALSHVVSDKTEAAYRRGDLFNKRRNLMDDWAKYCAPNRPTSKVASSRPPAQASDLQNPTA